MGGKSRKSGGISKTLVQRLSREHRQNQKVKKDERISTSSGKSRSKPQLLDE